jgi:hypothetical protein
VAVTHLDRVCLPWPVCTNYLTGSGDLLVPLDYCRLAVCQEIRTDALHHARPMFVQASSFDSLYDAIELAVGTPVTISSMGPKASHKASAPDLRTKVSA